MPFRLRAEGLDEVFLSLARIAPAIADLATDDGLVAAARVWARAARRNPLFSDRSGRLRKSIRGIRGQRRYRPSALIAFRDGGESVTYGYILEATGRPTLTQAREANEDAMTRALADAMRRENEKVAREIRSGSISGVRSRTLRAIRESALI